MHFAKYQGCGNDFIIMEPTSQALFQDPSTLASKICHRQLGIGADGLLFIDRKLNTFQIFNRDGSEASICGNGLRCAAAYFIDHGYAENSLTLHTKAGDRHIIINQKEPFQCSVSMGKPRFDSQTLGLSRKQAAFLHQPLCIDHQWLDISVIDTGVPHTLLYTNHLQTAQIEKIGAQISTHPLFQNQTNVDFIHVIDTHTIKVRTYERGVGLTASCGSGACAAAWLCVYDGHCKSPINVLQEGGELMITVDDEITMSGTAKRIAEGEWFAC